jgi:3-oxoacyl-[acyl-carrier protein] reductase
LIADRHTLIDSHLLIVTFAEKVEDVADDIRRAGGRAIPVVGDMLDTSFISRLVIEAAHFGNGKIHIIVNNAGYTWDGMLHKVRITALTIQV